MASSAKVQALVALLVASLAAQAVALPLSAKRQSISALSQSEIATFTPYTHYASAGYCKPATTLAWNCGANCQANPSFVPVASGGDSVVTQFCEFPATPGHRALLKWLVWQGLWDMTQL